MQSPGPHAALSTSSLVIPWHIGLRSSAQRVLPLGEGRQAREPVQCPRSFQGFYRARWAARSDQANVIRCDRIRQALCLPGKQLPSPLHTGPTSPLHTRATTKVSPRFLQGPGSATPCQGAWKHGWRVRHSECQSQGTFNPNPSGKAAQERLVCQPALLPSQEEPVLPR